MNETELNTFRKELVKIIAAERAKTISYVTDMDTYCYEIVYQADTLAYMTENTERGDLERPTKDENWKDVT